MGKLVPFVAKQDQARVAAMLEQAGELLQRRLRARELLPGLLATLAEGGQAEAVLEFVRLWGRKELAPEVLLEECEKLAAVAGLNVD